MAALSSPYSSAGDGEKVGSRDEEEIEKKARLAEPAGPGVL
jgi:hypothetical protein